MSVSMPSSSRPWVFGVLALVALVGLTVVGLQVTQPRVSAPALELYYSDPQAMFLVPVEQPSDLSTSGTPATWAEAVVGRLRQAPDATLVPVLTPDIELLEATFQAPQWNLKVQVGPGFGSVMERLVVGSLVRSFVASYPGADRVEVRLVDPKGKPYEGQHLDLSRALTRADFVNRLDSGAPASLNATVWWRVPRAAHLVPILWPLTSQTGSLPRDAFERLVAGPPSASRVFVEGVLPPGVKASWSGVEGTVARVALEGNLPAGPEGERFVRAAVLTLTEHPPIDAVRFVRGGQPVTATVGAFNLALPVQRPVHANRVAPPANAAHP